MKLVVTLLIACTIVLICAPRTQAQQLECYYVADSALSDEAALAAAHFAFPWRIGQPATDESRAVHQAFERTIEPRTRSFGVAWLYERTPQGTRYIRENGIVIQLRGADCASGLVLVQTYLQQLESIAPSREIATTLALFRQNAREVSRHDYDWASPPLPVAMERPTAN
jgi:hypothetical protein